MMKNCHALRSLTTLALLGVLSLGSAGVYGQEKPYTQGSVWSITMIRVKPGMFDVYMRDVLPLRKKINEEAKKQGLILSDHILSGNATGRDDFDVITLTEYKNWAALDGLDAKYEAIMLVVAERSLHSRERWLHQEIFRQRRPIGSCLEGIGGICFLRPAVLLAFPVKGKMPGCR